MSRKKKVLSEEEVDEIVISQAEDDTAWDKPVRVRRTKAAVLMFGNDQIAELPVSRDPEILSGVPVFRGTRVPVATLLDNLAAGLTLDQFLDNFPTVTREQAIKVLEFSKDTLTRLGHAA
ncbi:MAG TPA: DUF433 domain-containing protein [Pyrinomonadaceae bacterium]|nr:DUF433 domain-containing protein [Pyrinomonadaceae bacterium]